MIVFDPSLGAVVQGIRARGGNVAFDGQEGVDLSGNYDDQTLKYLKKNKPALLKLLEAEASSLGEHPLIGRMVRARTATGVFVEVVGNEGVVYTGFVFYRLPLSQVWPLEANATEPEEDFDRPRSVGSGAFDDEYPGSDLNLGVDEVYRAVQRMEERSAEAADPARLEAACRQVRAFLVSFDEASHFGQAGDWREANHAQVLEAVEALEDCFAPVYEGEALRSIAHRILVEEALADQASRKKEKRA